METFYIKNIKNLRQEKENLQERLDIKIFIEGRKVTIEGDAFQEYESSRVFWAIALGFSVKSALKLLGEDFVFRKIPIRNFTRRKNLKEVRARLIGTEGKTRRTVEQVSGCDIIVDDKYVGLIGPAEEIETASTSIVNLIKGSKQSNVYHYLEQSNTRKKFRTKGIV